MKLFSINQIVKTWVNENETYNITSLLRNTLILFKLKLERLHKFAKLHTHFNKINVSVNMQLLCYKFSV